MRLSDNLYDELHMEIMDIIGRHFDGELAKVAGTAEEITLKVQQIIEDSDELEEQTV